MLHHSKFWYKGTAVEMNRNNSIYSVIDILSCSAKAKHLGY